MLSLKLALQNFRQGFKTFAPFLMASVTMFVMIFVTASIALSPSIDKLRGAQAVGSTMQFAMVVLGIFGTIILIYSYRFLQLQRSKEYGLYDILGFGKGKVALVGFFELLMSYLLTLVVGTLAGIAFAKFLFAIFVHMIGGNFFNLEISLLAVSIVSVIFFFIFLILLFIGTFTIWKSSSLDLLKESSKGEKEPKGNIFLALLGIILLGAGYFIAITVDNPIKAILQFFIAVVLVILGTYLFYISFTIWYLKWRKKKNSYYQPKNFISISSMLYRMKANAVGLGNITILLSMTFVTLVMTIGLFMGTANIVNQQYPKEGMIIQFDEVQKDVDLSALAQKASQDSGVKISNATSMTLSQGLLVERKSADAGQYVIAEGEGSVSNKNAVTISLMTQDELRAAGNNIPKIEKNQVLVSVLSGDKITSKNLNWYGKNFEIVSYSEQVKNFPKQPNLGNTAVLVFSDKEAMTQALESYNKSVRSKGGNIEYLVSKYFYFDIQDKDKEKFAKSFVATGADKFARLNFRGEALTEQKESIGGFVFIGFVLGISFILGAALIIYYKQLSEGEQDKRSFKILQEVGLSKVEVAKTIKSQVRMVFFLPIIIAVIHFIAAFNMLNQIQQLFGLTDLSLLILITFSTIAGVAVIYWFIYKITSRVYYKIVERR